MEITRLFTRNNTEEILRARKPARKTAEKLPNNGNWNNKRIQACSTDYILYMCVTLVNTSRDPLLNVRREDFMKIFDFMYLQIDRKM